MCKGTESRKGNYSIEIKEKSYIEKRKKKSYDEHHKGKNIFFISFMSSTVLYGINLYSCMNEGRLLNPHEYDYIRLLHI